MPIIMNTKSCRKRVGNWQRSGHARQQQQQNHAEIERGRERESEIRDDDNAQE
jgi:hypothetical protein